MFNRANRWSLRSRLRLSVLACMAVLIGFLFVFDAVLIDYAHEQVRESHAEQSEQTRTQIQSLITTLEKTINQTVYSSNVQKIIFSDDPQTYLSTNEAALNQLNNSIELTPMIQGYYIERPGGYSIHTNVDYLSRKRYSLIIQEKDEQMSGARLFANQYVDVRSNDEERTELLYIVPFVNIQRDAKADHSSATAVVTVDPGTLVQRSLAFSSNDIVALLFDGQVLYSTGLTDRDIEAYAETIAKDEQEKSGTVTIGNTAYLQDVILLTNDGWYIAYWLCESELLRPIMQMRNVVLVGIIVGMGTLAFLLEMIQFRTFREIRLFNHKIEQLFNTPDDKALLPHMTELIPTAQKFSEMVQESREHNEQERKMSEALYASSLAQNQAILTAYRNQITPHFLFNTLETMRSMSHQAGSPELEALIRSTSQFLRYTLRSDQIVTLEEELKYIQVYCDILNARFIDRVEIKMQIVGEAMSMCLLSTILQPLVENSVSHGMDEWKQKIVILITADVKREEEKTFLELIITDNGCGIAPDHLTNLIMEIEADSGTQNTERIGLSNIYHRLRLHYGNEFAFQIRSREKHYTQVILKIPQERDHA